MSTSRASAVAGFLEVCESEPARTLLHHRGRDWSYGELGERALGIAAWLSDAGVRRGDRVAIAWTNGPEYVAAYFGVQAAGGCAVTLDAGGTGGDLAYGIDHSEAVAAVLHAQPLKRVLEAGERLSRLRACIVADASADAPDSVSLSALDQVWQTPAGRAVVPTRDDLAQIIYTSGTTGKPKGVVLSHGNLRANTTSILGTLPVASAGSVFVILPFSYSYGNSLLLTHATTGGRLVLAPDFVFWKDVLDAMQRTEAAAFAGIPSSFAMLMQRSDFLQRSWPHLRYLTCAGGALPAPAVRQLRESLPGVELYLMYGQTEASARLSCLPASELAQRPGSAGRAIPGVQLEIRVESGAVAPPGEPGEVVARGDNVMVGYWRDEEATARALRDGWLHTGDRARMDADGYLYIEGRADDVIKSGGYRISPQEIEDAILEVSGVAEAGVTGAPDPVLGAVPVAYIVVRGNAEPVATAVREHLKRRLARYKVPRDIHVATNLPRTANGKLQRRLLGA